jgi:hypothetical protein
MLWCHLVIHYPPGQDGRKMSSVTSCRPFYSLRLDSLSALLQSVRVRTDEICPDCFNAPDVYGLQVKGQNLLANIKG